MTPVKFRRINLYGGPGSGKSTTAAWLYSQLKVQAPALEVQLVHEWVKRWATERRPIAGFDQLYIFAKQLMQEESMLRNGVDVLVTDAPLRLMVAYAKRNKCLWVHQLEVLATHFEIEYPSFNIVLDRAGIPYQESARYETKQQAQEFDLLVYDTVASYSSPFLLSCADNRENILRAVLARLQLV